MWTPNWFGASEGSQCIWFSQLSMAVLHVACWLYMVSVLKPWTVHSLYSSITLACTDICYVSFFPLNWESFFSWDWTSIFGKHVDRTIYDWTSIFANIYCLRFLLCWKNKILLTPIDGNRLFANCLCIYDRRRRRGNARAFN